MRFSEIRAVYLKELLSLVRDRHVFLYTVAVPAFLYPVLFLGAVQVVLYLEGVEERRLSRVEVGLDNARELEDFLRHEKTENAGDGDGGAGKIQILPGRPPRDPELLRKRLLDPGAGVDAVLLGAAQGEDPAGNGRRLAVAPVSAEIYYSGAHDSSVMASERLETLLRDWREERLLTLARRLGEDEAFLQPIVVEETSHSTSEEVANRVAGLLLPLLMLVMTALGAYYPALDVTVGEKERGTLETTLLAPVCRSVQVVGKYAAVTTCALVSFAINFTSMSFTLYHLSTQLPMKGFHLGLRAAVVIALGAIFLAAFLSAVMMLLAFLARSFKEGQAYVTPIYAMVIAPVVVAMNPEVRLTPDLALVPLVNSTLLFRESLEGRFEPLPMALALASSAAIVVLVLWAAVRILSREGVATGGEVSFFGALAHLFQRRGREEVVR